MTLKLCALLHVCLHSSITKFECAYIESLYLLIRHTHILMLSITQIQFFSIINFGNIMGGMVICEVWYDNCYTL
jgi:hypothetical protein